MKLRNAALVLASVTSLLLGLPQAQAQTPANTTYKDITFDGGGWFVGFAQHKDPSFPNRIYGYGDVFGVWRSDDRTDTWKPLQLGFNNSDNFVMSVAVKNTDAKIIAFITSGASLYKSTDSGDSWSVALSLINDGSRYYGSTQLIHSPVVRAGEDEWWVARKRSGNDPATGQPWVGQLWRSIDGMTNWKKMGGNLFDGDVKPVTVYIHPDFPDQVWVGAEDRTSATTGGAGGLYVSTNRGESFIKVWGTGSKASVIDGKDKPLVNSIIRRPRNVGGEVLLGSNVGGILITSSDWDTPAEIITPAPTSTIPNPSGSSTSGVWKSSTAVFRQSGVGVAGVAVLPSGEFISGQDVSGVGTWIKKSSATPTHGGAWTTLPSVLASDSPVPCWTKAPLANNATPLPSSRSMIAIDQQDPRRWYTTGGQSPFISTNAGDTWKYPQTGNGLAAVNTKSARFPRNNPQKVLIAGSDHGIFVIDDGGASGNVAHCINRQFGQHQTYHEIMSGDDGKVIMAGGDDQSGNSILSRSTDGGATWTKVNLDDNTTTNKLPATNVGITRTVASFKDGNEIKDFLVLIGYKDAASKPGLYRTKDGGATFETTSLSNLSGVDTGSFAHPEAAWLERDPFLVDYRYLSLRGGSSIMGFYRSKDGGTTWERLTSATTGPYGTAAWIEGMSVDPVTGRIWVIASGPGMRYSDNQGDTWTAISTHKGTAISAHNGRIAIWGTKHNGADKGSKVYYSTNNGTSFAPYTQGSDVALGAATVGALRYGHVSNVDVDPYRVGKIWLTGKTSVHVIDTAADANPVFTSASSATGTENTAGFYYKITATSSQTTEITYTATGLPPGLALNSSGEITGTPTARGTYTVTITATGANRISTTTLSITVGEPTTPVVSGLIIGESFAYQVPSNSPDPDAGLNGGNGLPATNAGGSTSTGLRGNWGTMTDVVTGLTYSQVTKTLTTSGGAGLIKAGWGPQPYVYRNLTPDPFLAERVGSSNSGNFGVSGKRLYISFLAQAGSTNANAFRLSFRDGTGTHFYVSNTSNGWSLHDTTATGAALAVSTPTLMVMEFEFATSSTANIKLWVNPPLGSTLGTPNAVKTGVTFKGLQHFQTNSVDGKMTLDELRVGTTVEAVTPHATSGSSGNTDIPLSNAGFESDSGQEQAPAGWLSSATNSAHLAADYSEVWSARTGTRHLSHYFGNTPYQVRTYRTITGLATGTYTLKAWTMSNGPLTSAKMTAKGSNGTEVFTSIPVGDTYTERVISNISVTNGQLELGFESNSPGGADQWITVDDVSLIKN